MVKQILEYLFAKVSNNEAAALERNFKVAQKSTVKYGLYIRFSKQCFLLKLLYEFTFTLLVEHILFKFISKYWYWTLAWTWTVFNACSRSCKTH